MIERKLMSQAKKYKQEIPRFIRQYGEVYQKRGMIAHQKICDIETRLLKAITKLTELEVDVLIKIMSKSFFMYEEIVESILESQNQDFKQLAGIVKRYYMSCEIFPNIFSNCLVKYCRFTRYIPGWEKRKLEILKQRGNKCEECGSTTNLHVHHKRGLQDLSDEDLELLCKDCHMTKRHGWTSIKK